MMAGTRMPAFPSRELVAFHRLLLDFAPARARCPTRKRRWFFHRVRVPQRVHEASDRVIELLDGVAVFAPLGRSLKLRTHPERVVQHRVRQVEEEGLVLAFLHEGDRLVGVELRQFGGISGTLHDFAVSQEGHAFLAEVNGLDGVEV